MRSVAAKAAMGEPEEMRRWADGGLYLIPHSLIREVLHDGTSDGANQAANSDRAAVHCYRLDAGRCMHADIPQGAQSDGCRFASGLEGAPECIGE